MFVNFVVFIRGRGCSPGQIQFENKLMEATPIYVGGVHPNRKKAKKVPTPCICNL